MKVLITGATGFIGSHLAKKLVNKRYKVCILTSETSNLNRLKDIVDKITVFSLKNDNVESIFKKNHIDAIIHLSGLYIKRHENSNQINEMNNININIPSKIIEMATQYKLKYYINTGTFFEYKQTNKRIQEHNDIEPFDYYAATKVAFEDILKFYTKTKNISSTTLKLFSPYGEEDNDKIIAVLIKSLLNNKELQLTKGEQKLSFTYIDDIVEAYVKTLAYLKKCSAHSYSVFNIGNDRAFSVKQIVKKLEKISGKHNILKLGKKPYSNTEYMCSKCNPKKAEKILGWKAKTDIDEGLLKTYKYYRNKTV